MTYLAPIFLITASTKLLDQRVRLSHLDNGVTKSSLYVLICLLISFKRPSRNDFTEIIPDATSTYFFLSHLNKRISLRGIIRWTPPLSGWLTTHLGAHEIEKPELIALQAIQGSQSMLDNLSEKSDRSVYFKFQL